MRKLIILIALAVTSLCAGCRSSNPKEITNLEVGNGVIAVCGPLQNPDSN